MQHVFVKTKENLRQILKRLKKLGDKKIILIIPRGALILKKSENLTKLKKKAKILGKSIKLISNDPRMKKKQAKTKTKTKKKIVQQKSHLPSLTSRFFIIFVILVFIVAGASLYFILPRANIIISPKTEPLIVDLKIIIDENVQVLDAQTNKIPGELEVFEEQIIRRFQATGEKKVEAKARGIINVYNEFGPQTIIPSRFESACGKIFWSEKNQKLQAPYIKNGKLTPGITPLEVVAENPGAEYNINPTTFTMPVFKEFKSSKYNLIYGKSEESMTGGMSQETKLVTQDDINQAIESLKQEMRSKLELEFFEEKILIQESSVEPNTQTDAFNINLKIAFSVLSFNQDNLLSLIKENLLNQISNRKKLIREPSITYKKPLFRLDKGQMVLPVHVEQEVAWKIESDEFKKQLKNKTVDEVKYILERQAGISSVKVSFWPFWVKRVPSRIQIEVAE